MSDPRVPREETGPIKPYRFAVTCLHTSITYANPMVFHRAENIQIHSYYVPGPTREIHKFTVSHSVADQLCDRLVTTDQLVLYMP